VLAVADCSGLVSVRVPDYCFFEAEDVAFGHYADHVHFVLRVLVGLPLVCTLTITFRVCQKLVQVVFLLLEHGDFNLPAYFYLSLFHDVNIITWVTFTEQNVTLDLRTRQQL
jgi:hypothetical protein